VPIGQARRREQRYMSRGYVYVIDPHLGVEGRPVVKIGYTTRSPHRRLRELQTALPQRASLAAAVEFPNAEWAEKRLHLALAHLSVRANGGTEFFFLTSKEATELVYQLAYQVSVAEAKRAMEKDLEQFAEKISGGLAKRIAGWFALAGLVTPMLWSMMAGGDIGRIVANGLSGLWLALISGMVGYFVGEKIVKRRWTEDIAMERNRLLEKYPAARET
jgi:hypothetical protein